MGNANGHEVATDPHQPVQDFIRKWRERWPEWGIAEVFIPARQRPVVAIWFSLLQELTLAAWAGRESAPGLAKLAWWQDELNGWANGRHRHPLGKILITQPLSWTQLAQALNGLSVARDVVPERMSAAVNLIPLARILMACEAVLFEAVCSDDTDHRLILFDLLAEQSLLRGNTLGITHRLLERSSLVTNAVLSRPRRLHSIIVAGRLQQWQPGTPIRPLPAWRSLINAWRAARLP